MAHSKVRAGSGGPREGLGGVGSPTWKTRVVGRPIWRYTRGRVAHPKVWKGSGVPPVGPGGHPEVNVVSRGPADDP